MERHGSDWQLVLAPSRGSMPVVMVAVWGFCALVAWLFGFALPADTPGWYAWAPVVPFALLVTFFAGRSWLLAAGTITIRSDGFVVSDGATDRVRRRWDEVEAFFLDSTFQSPIYAGKSAPHFRLKADGSVDWLPQNGGHSAEQLVAIMEGARRLASAGWPIQPTTPRDLVAWSHEAAPQALSPR